jgi:F-type H+-transporting ATPase subunit gamma
MSRVGKLKRHRESLADIREIMNSMKSLAYMETRKLGHRVEAQRTIVEAIEQAATDLLSFHPAILPRTPSATRVHIVIGTERGFCGEFNERLARHEHTDETSASPSITLAVGSKLHARLQGPGASSPPHRVVFVDGASVVEEVEPVLERIVTELESLRNEHGVLDVTAVYHRNQADVSSKRLLPPFEAREPPSTRRHAHEPCLNLRPDELIADLTEHYVLASLHEILYASLLYENQHRTAHLGLAVKHLDRKLTELVHKANALRQEEITEEIEVILLSSADLVEPERSATER